MEIKRIRNLINIFQYIITFEYETKKGYKREQQRFIYEVDKSRAKATFIKWTKEIRTMFNVKILNIVETENKKVIEL